ncbi:NAD(P)H-binding protein [Corynebacterium epidermidicanis]|uniref:NADH(P)-binding n=1 Tax=Corynebacterium epidermidicanis TaxID=1050174 RepID=A0A0G3GPR9_9CORY|nr:NAD(P)H-binding protein [Corynebacterium epidermidicanis]AKK03186.1 NADH(P)-binding [Corynebacterium epidermidicanis]
MTRKVLIIGGHGKVALLAALLLKDAGFDVTSMIRNPDHESDVIATGAQPLVQDLTTLSVERWQDVLGGFDSVVWSAGAGGKGTSADTYAIDRDGAMRMIDALEQLGDSAPHLVMVSYFGSVGHSVPEHHGFYPYADAKETVDVRLAHSTIKHVILAPATLTDDPTASITVHEQENAAGDLKTSRSAVAQMIVQAVNEGKESGRIAFTDA